MIRIWAKAMLDNKIQKDIIYETIENYSRESLFDHLSEICYQLNIPTPVLLDTHYYSYENFNNIKFLASDFVESINFDYLMLENANE